MNFTELPNPTTNLAFLPPKIANEVQIGRYVPVGVLGALLWDILGNAVWDIKFLYNNPIRFPTVCYFLSRIFSFAYVFISVLYETAPIGHCYQWLTSLSAFYGLSIGSTTFLFFLRLRALFIQSKYVVAFFFALWMAVAGMNLSTIHAIGAAKIGPTQFCIQDSVKQYVFLAGVISLVHDTLAYIAITIRLVSGSYGNKNRARIMVLGESLPRFSKTFLEDSQLYFLITVIFNIVAVAMAYTTSLSGTYRTMFTVANVMVSNCMACHLFRRLRFNLNASTSTSSSMGSGTTSHGSHGAQQAIPLALRSNPNHTVTGETKLSEDQGENVLHLHKPDESV